MKLCTATTIIVDPQHYNLLMFLLSFHKFSQTNWQQTIRIMRCFLNDQSWSVRELFFLFVDITFHSKSVISVRILMSRKWVSNTSQKVFSGCNIVVSGTHAYIPNSGHHTNHLFIDIQCGDFIWEKYNENLGLILSKFYSPVQLS